MAQEAADLVCGFGREDVFELAGLLLDFRFAVEGQAVGEKAFSQAVPADNVGGTQAAAGREFHDHAAVADGDARRLKCIMARIHEWFVIVCLRWMRFGADQAQGLHLFDRDTYRQGSVNFHTLDFGNFSVLFDGPEFFEDFVKLLLVGHGENFLIGDLAVVQFDPAIGQAGDDGIMGDHHDGASLAMQFAQQAQDNLFVDRIQIAGGLVGQNDLGIVDQGARDADSLLLAAG